MRRYYITSGILFVLPIIDFAIAAPVRVQKEPRVGVEVVQSPKDATTMLGKRGLDLFKIIGFPVDDFPDLEDFVINPGPRLSQPSFSPTGEEKPPSTPEEPSVTSPDPPPSSGSLTESEDKLDTPPAPSGPAKSTMSRLS
ncbi:hypothetical protein BGY98DRAFT_1100588 [Russula aff. rugulosa BPL654]|nr:hypothetical protein BGY98DRAFT_1100588 [Russula aff. rugulosa BPL654]